LVPGYACRGRQGNKGKAAGRVSELGGRTPAHKARKAGAPKKEE